jgi:hypothetical protein
VIVTVTVLIGAFTSLTINRSSGPTVGTTSLPAGTGTTSVPSSTTSPTTSTPEPAELLYLGRLQPGEGDVPDVGSAQLAEHVYPISLLYQNIGSTPSIAAACESRTSCRATSYELLGRFTRFQATVGRVGAAAGSSSRESTALMELWSVLVDGRTVKHGELMPNSRPDSIDVPLAGARELELRMLAEPGVEGTIVWGNARIR